MTHNPYKRGRYRRALLRQLYDAQGRVCPACGVRMPPWGEPALQQDLPSLDHVVPRVRGGGNHAGNMLAMHVRCNSAKGDRLPTGCELIWHEMVLSKLELSRADYIAEPYRAPMLGDLWPV